MGQLERSQAFKSPFTVGDDQGSRHGGRKTWVRDKRLRASRLVEQRRGFRVSALAALPGEQKQEGDSGAEACVPDRRAGKDRHVIVVDDKRRWLIQALSATRRSDRRWWGDPGQLVRGQNLTRRQPGLASLQGVQSWRGGLHKVSMCVGEGRHVGRWSCMSARISSVATNGRAT